MNTERICFTCGKALEANAPAGLCPECLIKAGLGTGVDLGADTKTGAARPAFVPPSVEELAKNFPQLEILELIGKGGMGAVYKARQPRLNRIVALKILPPGIGQEPAFAARFTREAQALAQLNHPGIVTLYEFGEASGQFYFLMEFVDGVNLRQLLAGSRVSTREALAIVPQICDALQFAHDQGIVHRDIKPENILMDRRGRVKVADFGLAKIIDGRAGSPLPAADSPNHSLAPAGGEGRGEGAAPLPTDASKVMGTPQYMSPEQIPAPGEVDHRADIYALGVVFYQMLTGELPGKQLQPPSTKVQIDVRLDAVVLRALEKKPELRYQQVSDVKTMCETIASTPSPAGEANVPPIAPGGAPVIPPPETFWQMLKARLWPPMVVRRNGQRAINWPAVALRGIRGLLLLIPIAAIFILGGIRSHESGWIAWFGIAWLGFGLLFLSAVLAIRVMRGFSRPLNELPDLDNPVNKSTAPAASQTWQAPTMGWGHFIGYLQGTTFTSPLAYKLANLSALGFLCFLGFMPLPGWKGFFGFSGFFGLIGLSTLIEMVARSKARRSGNNNQQLPRGLNLGRWQSVLLLIGSILLSVAAFVVVLKQVISQQYPWQYICLIIAPMLIVGSLLLLAGNWLKRVLIGTVPVALVVVLLVNAFLLQSYKATTDAVAPEIPFGSRVVVWKIPYCYAPGDVIAYRYQDFVCLGRVATDKEGKLVIRRNHEPDTPFWRVAAIGKVITVLWRGTTSETIMRAEFEARLLRASVPEVESRSTRYATVLITVAPDLNTADVTFTGLREMRRVAGTNVWTNIEGSLKASNTGGGLWRITGDGGLGNVSFITELGDILDPARSNVTYAAQNFSFAPVIQRVVTNMIDFDTGALIDFPMATQPGERDDARYDWIRGQDVPDGKVPNKENYPWMRAHGVDAVEINHDLENMSLMPVARLEDRDWNSLTPAGEKKLLAMIPPGAATESFNGLGTYGFKTQEGNLGIVQITDQHLPRGVKLRYKLVQSAVSKNSEAK